MKLRKHLRKLPLYAYCCGCTEWKDSGSGIAALLSAEATGHANASGHEVRLVRTQEIIIRPAPELAPAGAS